jgi:hypothetical protein
VDTEHADGNSTEKRIEEAAGALINITPDA